jgi:hypothetical protein
MVEFERHPRTPSRPQKEPLYPLEREKPDGHCANIDRPSEPENAGVVRETEGQTMSNVHEFMILNFDQAIEDAEQVHTMRALDIHLEGCTGLVGREYLRGADGRWVEHVT